MTESIQVECPECHRKHNRTMHKSINTMMNRELIPKLVSGELTMMQCECGKHIQLIYPILVNTMTGFNSSIMIQFAPQGKERALAQHKQVAEFTKLLVGVTSTVDFEAYDKWEEFISRVKEVERLEV